MDIDAIESKVHELEALVAKVDGNAAIDPITVLTALKLAIDIIKALRK
jgi:hypothetical protein